MASTRSLLSQPSLTVRVTDYIFDHIRRNQLGSGEQLPSEVRTSTELNVSRGVVREAFRSLEVAGIIDKENGRSPRVGSINSAFLTHLMVHALRTRQVSLRQVLELRASIEVKAAGLAAVRCTQAELEKLRNAVEGMRASIDHVEQFVHYDLEFHHCINSATGNLLFEMTCAAMLESMRESMRAGMIQRRSREEVCDVVNLHRSIVAAMEQGDAAQAESCMRTHFDDTFKVVDRMAN